MAAHLGARECKHRVARLETNHARANRFDDTRQLCAQNGLARSGKAKNQPDQQAKAARNLCRPQPSVAGIDCGGVDANQHLIRGRRRGWNFGDMDHLGRAIAAMNGGFHVILIAKVAAFEGKTAHALMLDTLQAAMDDALMRQQFYGDGKASYSATMRTNAVFGGADVKAYVLARVAGGKPSRPQAQWLDAAKPTLAE